MQRNQQAIPKLESKPVSRLRLERTRRGLTLREVSKVVGCGHRSLCTWETKGVVPRVEMLSRLAAAYGVAITDLLEDGGSQS